jgi:hypothetical protein
LAARVQQDSLRSEVLLATRAVARGRLLLTRKISRMMQEDYIREREQRGSGLTTVETHRTHILQTLGLHTIPELILYAVRRGIIA